MSYISTVKECLIVSFTPLSPPTKENSAWEICINIIIQEAKSTSGEDKVRTTTPLPLKDRS